MSDDTVRAITALPKEIFETPERLVRPDWAGHLPFLACLLHESRPKRYVELGVFHGDSYCYACQIAVRLGLETECVGIDSWEGDIHTGDYGQEVYADLKAHHDPRYSGFSDLRRGFFEDQLDEFDDESIDLLHIDGEHTYDAVSRDFWTWLPKVRPGGIVLLHDTDVFERDDFGVWKLWEELSSDRPSFRFSHCNGLGVLLKGSVADAPRPLEALFNADAQEQDTIRSFFEAVGVRYVFRAHLGLVDDSILVEEGSRDPVNIDRFGTALAELSSILAEEGSRDPVNIDRFRTALAEHSRINKLLSRSKFRKLRYVLSGRI